MLSQGIEINALNIRSKTWRRSLSQLVKRDQISIVALEKFLIKEFSQPKNCIKSRKNTLK